MLGNFMNKISNLNTKMVFIVRTDLKMSHGKIIAQCAHAAICLYKSALESKEVPLKAWLLTGQPKIVLKSNVDAEAQLKELYKIAKQQNLNSCLIHDAGKTQIKTGTITVLGIGPGKSDDIDKLTKNLKLL